MTVAMTKIEADGLGTAPGKTQTPSLLSASEYNIADVFRKINPRVLLSIFWFLPT